MNRLIGLLKLRRAATPGEWIIRTHPHDASEFHVQAPRILIEHPYDIEVMGEDDTLYPTRRADAEFISEAANFVKDLGDVDTGGPVMQFQGLFTDACEKANDMQMLHDLAKDGTPVTIVKRDGGWTVCVGNVVHEGDDGVLGYAIETAWEARHD